MKPFRITVILLALLVLPLFMTQALAANFVADTVYVAKSLVSAHTVHKPVIGFTIPGNPGVAMDKIILKSYIDSYNATQKVELYRENHANAGFQYGEDVRIAWYTTSGGDFDIMDTIILSPSYTLSNTTLDTFYITLDINEGIVQASPELYDGTCLEVVMELGRIKLKNGSYNTNHVHNIGWLAASESPYFDPYKLCFDCLGPDFDLHFCMPESTCSLLAYYPIEPYIRVLMVDQEDSIRICATDVESDIDSSEGIHIIGYVNLLGPVPSEHMFGVPDLMLECPNTDPYGCDDGVDGKGDVCDSCWSTGFRIPVKRNDADFIGVDADTGHWAVWAWAMDTLGNVDTNKIDLAHENLPYRIDTKKPIIDEISWEFVEPNGDLNGDGIIGLGDCIMIIARGTSNPIEPLKECVQMRVDTSWMAGNTSSYPGGEWAVLSDTLQENNRIFRRVFCLNTPVAIDSNNGCPVNFLVEAWDNACNWDTSRGEICADMDLDPPSVSVSYDWWTDYDTMWACMSLGDSVKIRADVGGTDIVSVTAMMDSMGIDALMRHAVPLPHISGGWYEINWNITEPPIQYGKDRDNTQPPARDSVYGAWVTVCDDAHNCVTGYDDLNKVLDTRRPRPIGYFCPDSVPCALVATPLPGGMIKLEWDTACDENDAYGFYVEASYNGSPFDSIGYTSSDEQPISGQYWSWHSEPLAEGYWRFKIKTEDNCSNVGDFSCVVGAYADATPPHVCIALPDSGLTFGSWFPLKAVADSESHDVKSACLWYRLRPDIENPTQDPGGWKLCIDKDCMYRPDDGIVFTDSVHCLEGVEYIGWVEMIVVACDEVGNCQDTTMAYDDACVVDDDVFRPGRFLFYWDTLAPGVHVVSVNGFPSPQSACGYDVNPDSMNPVVIDVDGATSADSFEVDVRAMGTGIERRIFHQDFVTMPCTIWVSVDGWPEGPQDLYIYVKNYDNNKTSDLQVELCVPPSPPDHCIYIAWPHEWMRIPCTGTSGYNRVQIRAEMYEYYQCDGVNFTEVRFQWSPNGIDPWETIADVIGGGPTWTTWWDNTGEVEDGDTVYFRVIAHDQYYMADTSYLVKVFVDCEQPKVKLRIEDLFYTCGNETPKVSCDPLTLKAVLEDTLIDIDRIRFFFKRHSVPDIHDYWIPIDGWAEPAWSDNIWMYLWNEPCCQEDVGFGDGGAPQINGCMYPNDYWDIRIAARDIAGHYMFDYDEDGFFDDSTFNDAVAFGSGITVYVDKQAPEPAISLVKDVATGVAVVNPSELLGGTDEAYVQAGHDITAEISVLPSEDTCEVMKVEWYLGINQNWVHVGTSFDPYHYPVTFNPVADGLIQPYELEDGWWSGPLMAELHDSLGNVETDEITLYILDITPTQALITSPLNESYVWGNVPLRATALNAYQICKLCYEYRPESDSVWYPVNGGYPNACITVQEEEGPIRAPGMSLGSNPGDNCGNPIELYLPADLPFRDQNQTTCGRKDDDNDGCLQAWDGAEDIYYELIITQSVYLDIMLNPKGTDSTAMAIDNQCPLHGSCIYKKTNSSDVTYGWTNLHLDPGTYYLQIDGRWDGPDCIQDFDLSIIPHGFPLEWLTLNTVPDGVYYLRAVATDCDNNVDDNPHTIRVTVSNELPSAVIEDPGICKRPCADNPEDTLSYVAGTVTLYATASSTIPVNRVVFYYKSIFGYPDTYAAIDSDYFPTGDKYSVEWNTSLKVADGRYHLKARVYNAAGRYADSDPVVVSVDNSPPFVDIISFNGLSYYPNDTVNISLYDTIAVEVVAIDSTSDEGWTRCYNSGVVSLGYTVDNSEGTSQYNWFTSFHDGDTVFYWNVSGLPIGVYCAKVIAVDCLGNPKKDSVFIKVTDVTPPMVVIGGFYGNYIYGYTDDPDVKTLKLEYRKIEGADTSAWLGIAEPDPFTNKKNCSGRTFYYWSWNPSHSLLEGEDISYQARILSTDNNGNFSEFAAPIVNFIYSEGAIIPESGPLGALSFEKNFMVGRMHGIVKQTSANGDEPEMFALYLPTSQSPEIECVEMQQNLNVSTHFAGSFEAGKIWSGGKGIFFSSITKSASEQPPMTGEEQLYTYIRTGDILAVKVDRDLGTFTTYCTDDNVCVYVPGGAVSSDKHVVVWPEDLPPVSLFQPTWIPVGDENGFATYVGFTEDCDGGKCCFQNGRYAKIRINYSSELNVPAESLVVAWWDNSAGKWKTDSLAWGPPWSEGFNTEEHYVEFVAKCLLGPFAVIHLGENPCNGTIVVSLREQYPDITPYSNGYTSTTPKFTGFITDNVQGTGAITQSSITFKIDNQRIYDGSQSSCNRWAKGFGNFEYSGYDLVSGLFRAGWSVTNSNYPCWDYDHMFPAPGLAAGYHMATLTAQNKNIQTCTDTVNFAVDATPPIVYFEEKCVGSNPEFNVYIIDRESGVNKDSVWIYLDEGPTDLSPDQLGLMWVNDTTIHVKVQLNLTSTTDLDVYVYEGTKGANLDPSWEHGPVDMVGNKATTFWHRYRVDVTKPTIALMKPSYRFRRPVLFNCYDDFAGCGIYSIKIDECTSPTGGCTPAPAGSWSYDRQTEILSYNSPASGAWIQVTVKDSAHNTRFLDSTYCVEDYDPPMVSFVPGYNGKYVGSNPTIKFVVTDGVAGVNWETVNARISGCSNICDYPWTEVLNRMQNDTVTLSCPLACSDGGYFDVYVYSDYYYNKGPADMGDNYIKNAQTWRYWVDASGPSITLKTPSDSLCNIPLLFEIKDTYSGFDTVYVYEDSSLVVEGSVLVRDPHIPNYWRYTPTAGKTRLDIKAVDKLGNETWYGMAIKTDCAPPLVSFLPGFVDCKTPTVKIVVTDAGSGVNWQVVKVDLYTSTKLLETFEPSGPISFVKLGDTVTVVGDGAQFNLSDNSTLSAAVYTEKTSETSYSKGPKDLAGNWTPVLWISKEFKADCAGPDLSIVSKKGTDQGITYTLDVPVKIKITDARSGIDWSTLLVLQDSLELPADSLMIDEVNGLVEFFPSARRHQMVVSIKDKAGNLSSPLIFWTEAGELYITDEHGAHNFPNPFDPREVSTAIVLGLSKSAEVTAKIYDFAGEFVRTLVTNELLSPNQWLYWDGKTEDGETEVANGTYLCHIKARDPENSKTVTAVIKITVLKEDK